MIRDFDHAIIFCMFMCCSPTYNITITQIRVGTTLLDVDLTALFDSGTSFTYLVDPIYAKLSESVSTLSLSLSTCTHPHPHLDTYFYAQIAQTK